MKRHAAERKLNENESNQINRLLPFHGAYFSCSTFVLILFLFSVVLPQMMYFSSFKKMLMSNRQGTN